MRGNWSVLDRLIKQNQRRIALAGTGFTIRDFAARYGLSSSRARERVLAMVRTGILRKIGDRREGASGVYSCVYDLAPRARKGSRVSR